MRKLVVRNLKDLKDASTRRQSARSPLPLYYVHFFFRPKALHFPQSKLVYVPIEKVANSSIRNAIGIGIGEDQYLSTDERDFRNDAPFRIVTLAEVARLTDCFRFSFVRSPLDRLASCYRDKIADYDPAKPLFREYRRSIYPFIPFEEFYPGMTFADFVESVCRIPDRLAERHFRSQYCSLYHRGELAVDFVGKFESLNQDWEVVRSHSDLGELPHINPSGFVADDRTDLYTPELANMVASRYAQDFHLFGYRDRLQPIINGTPAD